MSRFIHGLDPASKDDAFGIVTHELPAGSTMPRLRMINKLTGTTFDAMYKYLVQDLFQRFPPYYIVIDYTNEKTFSDLLVRLYGKEKVELVSFSNERKLMLKEDGLSVLRQGYKFPNPEGHAIEPQLAQHVKELVAQLQHEQMLETKGGKTTFDHPPGQHNDLAIAWELSIHGCLRFMTRAGQVPAIMGANMDGWQEYEQSTMSTDELSLARVRDNIMKRLKGLNATNVDVKFTD